MNETVKLTQFSRQGGCGCKIAPEKLYEIIHDKESVVFKQLLVGNTESDDAAVFDLGNGTSVISTVDFFMPIVDDPFLFGSIAAANAISDVYAMGGTPVMAVAILGFPISKIQLSVAKEIKAGAEKICHDSGIPLAGGHSVDSLEPMFGLAVTGIIPTENVKRNSTANEGDYLLLTKPLGAGIITAALKRGVIQEKHLEQAMKHMTTVNAVGKELGKLKCVNAMTDVTGFGLAGHLKEMCTPGNLSVEVYFEKLPLMDGVKEYISKFIYPDMTTKVYSSIATVCNELNSEQLFITCDPQTNGGLLLAVTPDGLNEVLSIFDAYHIPYNTPIGRFTSRQEKMINVI